MKAEKVREFSKYNCSMCSRNAEIMDKGICAPLCVEFKLDAEIEEELNQIEASSEIGEAFLWGLKEGLFNNISLDSLIKKYKESIHE